MPPIPSTTAILADLTVPAQRWHTPILIGLFGLPGTGKTHLAQYLAQRHPLVVLSTDVLRRRYGFATGPATHAAMADVVRRLVIQRVGVVWDGLHLSRQDRAHVRRLAQHAAAQVRLLYTLARPEVIAQRLNERRNAVVQTHDAGKYVITSQHFQRIASYLEEPDADEGVVRIDTSDDDLEPQLAALEAELNMWQMYRA